MVQRVYERVRRAARIARVLVATDDERIAAVVRGFGGEAVLTSPHHATGTDRLAEAAASLDADVIVNVQGYEPMIEPDAIDAVVAPFADDPSLPISTVSLPLRSLADLLSPTVVKVVTDARGNALYFSRSPIPFVRDGGPSDARSAAERAIALGLARQHVGLYAYRKDALLRFAALPRSPLEDAEGLEQLRALAAGMVIRVVPREGDVGRAVDTPADLEQVRLLLADAAHQP
jgi:3-deoxy-manno-octulosonate cytidylyltransferase (CMP-KDO synthetase)